VNNSTTYTTESVLTPVGAFSLAQSYYGTFDQGGNVAEWDEFVSGSGRAIVGGGFGETAGAMQASNSLNVSTPESIYGNVGFRIAMAVPEPGTAGLLAFGGMLAFGRLGRKR